MSVRPQSQPMPQVEGVEHTWVNAGGLRTHVALAGPEDGRPVLLLHGWPQHWWLWREVIPRLAVAGLRVHAPDLRGLGWSEASTRCRDYDKRRLADDVIALLDELRLDRVLMAGHDWGGWVGFIVAMTAPERVDRFMPMNIPPPWLDPGPFDPVGAARAASRLWYQVLMASPVLSRVAQAGRGRGMLADAIVKGTVRREVWEDGVLDVFLDQFQDPARSRASQCIYRSFLLRELPLIQAGRYLHQRLTVPTRLLFGLGDAAIDPTVLDGDHSQYADELTIERVEDCGHFIVDERPELVGDRLLEYFT